MKEFSCLYILYSSNEVTQVGVGEGGGPKHNGPFCFLGFSKLGGNGCISEAEYGRRP